MFRSEPVSSCTAGAVHAVAISYKAQKINGWQIFDLSGRHQTFPGTPVAQIQVPLSP